MQRSFITLLFVLTCLLAGTGVRAEGFVDLYAGWARTDFSTATVTIPPEFVRGINSSTNLARVVSNADVRTTFDSSWTAGLRGGYWFANWFGLAVDAFYFQPELDGGAFTLGQKADVKVFPISALFLFRWPLLRSERYPLGRLHPYAGAGPSLFITTFDGTVNLNVIEDIEWREPPADYGPVAPGKLSSTNFDPGLETVAGVDYLILPFMGLFAEYKYTLANPVWKDTVSGISTQYSVPLRTHHFVGGLTFRF